MCCSKPVLLYTLIIVGLILAIGSAVFAGVWSTMFFSILKHKLVLSEHSYSYDIWKETPFPQYLELFLYNFTNVEDVMADPNVKPNFQENGPYTFKEHRIKMHPIWNNNRTVTFGQKRIWNYIPEMSTGDLTDEITNLNMIAASASYSARDKSALERAAVNAALKLYGEGVTVTKTAGELLFDGYSDPLLDMVNNVHLPGVPELPFDRFGWFYGRNKSETFDGTFNMHTGEDDIGQLGKLMAWNFQESLDYYDDRCGLMTGSAGEFYPPRTNPDFLEVFAPDICSYITLRRNGTREVEKMTGALFRGGEGIYDNGTNYEEAACFCRPGNMVCPPAGSRNVSICRYGAAAFISNPHFAYADPSYLDRITGITVDETADTFEMALELRTGVPLHVKAQIQINILLQRVPGIGYFDKLPNNLYFPMLWFRQEVIMTEDLGGQVRSALAIDKVFPPIFYTLIAIGVVMVLIASTLLIKHKKSLTQNIKMS